MTVVPLPRGGRVQSASGAAQVPAEDGAPLPPDRAFLVTACAGCGTANEVEVPVRGDKRSFHIRCFACSKLNQLTIDTGGGPIVVARTPPGWAAAPAADGAPAAQPDRQGSAA
eukprot:scaffold2843_cov90-Isochrysis_galbana.AAC.1